jgi:acetylornithine deacetylase/succinyl-diaminopimelate desuccinylase-like protein
MRAAGMHAHIDAVGNVVGRFLSTDPQARTLITGSHYDTVRNGGQYDGRQGILTAIAVVRHMNDKGISLPFHLEVIAFAEEEGVRFKSTFLGSSAVIGQFDPALLDLRDRDGILLRDVLAEAGQDLSSIDAIARDPSDLLGYVEVHIEQGPVLLDQGLPVGIVTSIGAKTDSVCQARNMDYTIEQVVEAGCAPCAPWLMAQLSAAVERTGVTPFQLASGAGHDAMMMSRVTDVAMLFTRCGNGGIGHNPLEALSVEDADVAARVLLDFLRHFKPKPSRPARRAQSETAETQEYTQ